MEVFFIFYVKFLWHLETSHSECTIKDREKLKAVRNIKA
jgi:hypothetical protein